MLCAIPVPAIEYFNTLSCDAFITLCFSLPFVYHSDISVTLGMLDSELKDELGMPVTVRKVFVIGPDKKIKVELTYPPMYASCGSVRVMR